MSTEFNKEDFLEFFKKEESELIQAIEEETWKEEKMYFVDEIAEIVDKYIKSKQ